MEVISQGYRNVYDCDVAVTNLRFDKPKNNLELGAPERFLAADEFINRFDIETQALELIANRNVVTPEYKTEQTYYDDARTLLFEALTASLPTSPRSGHASGSQNVE